jgi:hypothetical protein
MKYKKNYPYSKMKTAKSLATLFQRTLAMLFGCLAPNSLADVQVTQFDPPLNINAYSDVPDGLLLNVLATDFNVDGDVDFRLAYGYGGIGAYFNTPTRFARKAPRPGVIAIGDPVAAVPLCSIVGSNIVSAIATNHFAWSPGYTNRYDLTQPLGDHEANVITANLTPGIPPGPVISISTNGLLVTNIYYGGPVVSGDVAGKEAVMALEFTINGQTHYGYIHFDFRSPNGTPFGGAGGLFHGWAYETEPGVPIKAVPLSVAKDRDEHGSRDERDNNRHNSEMSRQTDTRSIKINSSSRP